MPIWSVTQSLDYIHHLWMEASKSLKMQIWLSKLQLQARHVDKYLETFMDVMMTAI